MNLMSIDGGSFPIKIGGARQNSSSGHILAKKILSVVFPKLPIFEEVSVKVIKNKYLYLDFLVPSIWLAIEIQGKQHSEYNSFHFKDKMDFYRLQGRDKIKREWCELNDIALVELKYGEENLWEEKLKQYG